MGDFELRTARDSQGKLLRTALLVGVSAFAIGGLAKTAAAQDTPVDESATQGTPGAAAVDSEEDDIVITGVRASLTAAMDIKRDASGVVDAVSAEDIGKFPDTNLAESLQRIPGVTIERRNGEGARVTVRGFGSQYNLVTMNGRQLATSDVATVGGDQNVDFARATSRSFDFSNLASEGVSRLEVYKTGRSAIPQGGIGATINIVTMRPLEGGDTGLRGSVSGKALYDTSNDDFTVNPELSGIASWSDDEDMFGLTIFGSYAKRESAAASATVNDWNIARFANMPGRGPGTVIDNAPADPSQFVAIPNDSRYHYSESERERINGQATFQVRPMETMTITADVLYAQNKIEEQRTDQTNWFNRPFDNVRFDGHPVVATAIYLDEGTLYDSKDIGFEQQFRASKSRLNSYGVNFDWEFVEGLTLNLDGNHSKSKTSPDAPNGTTSTLVAFGAPVVDAHSVDFSDDIPKQDWTLNDCYQPNRGNCNQQLDIGDLGTQVGRTNAVEQEHRVNQLRADLGWDFGEGRFDIGGTYIESKMTSQRVQTQQQLGDWGITQVGDVQSVAGDLVHQFCMQCQFSSFDATDAQVAFRGNAVDLYNVFSPHYAAMGPINQVSITGNDFDEVNETIYAIFAQFTWNGELFGRRAGLVAGARWENTKVESTALVDIPLQIVWKSDNDFTREVSGVLSENVLEGEYNNLLPAIDFRIEPADDVVARVSFSKTIARPDYGNLFAAQTANAPNRPIVLQGIATGATGNPGLKPLVSTNFDVSLEWYFGPSSYVSGGFFYKKVKNFDTIAQISQPLFGLRDPSSGAPGTLSGDALDLINSNGILLSDVTLFTMAALIQQNGGNEAAALAQFNANYNAATQTLSQAFVDQVLAAEDIIAGPNDPLFNFSVSTPINSETGNIHGFELQFQHFFGETGFGIAGSLTKVYGDVDVDIGADPSSNIFALVGLADSFNITGIFEKYGFSGRVAYNWRGKVLAQTNRQGSRNPVFFEPFGTLDASLSYDVTSNIAVTLEAVNLLGEDVRSYARTKPQLWFAQEQDPRFWLGARYRF
jgi:TonB-dependent receptor